MNELLEGLHKAVGNDFLEKISRGESDPSLLREACKFLKDNERVYARDLNDTQLDTLANSVIEIEGMDPAIIEGFKIAK